jgi:transposase
MTIYVGIDVSKHLLHVCCQSDNFEVKNHSKGINKLIHYLQTYSQNELIIVCEATGGYERKLIKQLKEQGYQTHVAHANKIRAFAKSTGLLAKTDKLDARLIVDYAATLHVPADVHFLDDDTKYINELLKRREQLQSDKLREQARLDKDLSDSIRRSVDSHMRWLDREIAKLDKVLAQQSQKENLQPMVDLLVSIPGIGRLTALILIAFLPELKVLEANQLTALVGLAPFNRDSGKYRGKRFIQGGRAVVRKALYMAAIASLRWNSDLRNFYQHLRQRGKPVKVAVVAVMRKLLLMINSVVKRQSPWQEKIALIT